MVKGTERDAMIKPINEDLIEYCRYVLTNPYLYAILDTETTGFACNEVIDLAIIDPTGTVLYNGLFKPKHAVESSAQAVHHISGAMVANAPSFADEWPKICLDGLQSRTIITYNAVFDEKVMRNTANMHGVSKKSSWPSLEWQCLMRSYASYFGAPPKEGKIEPAYQKLQLACQQQGIDIGQQEHRALSDTLTTLALIKRVAQLGSATRKYCETPEPWPSMVGIDELLSKQQPQQQNSVFPETNNTFQSATVKPSESQCGAKQKTSRDLGTCCRCNKPAIYLSPSGNLKSVYCQQHGRSKCGVHTIEDFVFDNKRGIWLDPCVVDKEIIKDAKQQSLSLAG